MKFMEKNKVKHIMGIHSLIKHIFLDGAPG